MNDEVDNEAGVKAKALITHRRDNCRFSKLSGGLNAGTGNAKAERQARYRENANWRFGLKCFKYRLPIEEYVFVARYVDVEVWRH